MYNYIIEKCGRYTEDFLYMFQELPITAFFSSNPRENGELYKEKNIIDEEGLKKRSLGIENMLVLCRKHTQKEILIWQNKGYLYQRHFIFAEDMFEDLDFPKSYGNRIGERTIVIWGAGKTKDQLLSIYPQLDFDCYIDNNKELEHTFIEGKRVVFPGSVPAAQWKKYFVIVASCNYLEIKKDLIHYGLEESLDFVNWSILCEKPSVLLKRVIEAGARYDFRCTQPFSVGNIYSHTGKVGLCTCSIVKEVGSLFDRSMYEIWNSVNARIFRLSVLNQSYIFCNEQKCVYLKQKECTQPQPCNEAYIEASGEFPQMLNIAYDYTCNLACESCRTRKRIAGPKEQKQMEMIEERIKELLVSAKPVVKIAGNGEVFFSKSYRRLLYDELVKSVNHIIILTNGVLFNQAEWDSLAEHYHGNLDVFVSVDAATEETYQSIRGSTFSVLESNLRMLGRYRQEGKINHLILNYVIQKKNYEEMEQFVELALSIAADRINFSRLANWGTYTEEEYNELSMFNKDGSPKPQLQSVMDKPLLQHEKVLFEQWQIIYDEFGAVSATMEE